MSAPSNGASLFQISANEKDVLDIITTLDVNKATGQNVTWRYNKYSKATYAINQYVTCVQAVSRFLEFG